jgi:[ribosomal protein S5]-alanine N-acetyltransferase
LDIQSLFDKFPQLETPRLQLATIAEVEASAMLRLYQNKELAQYNAWAKIKTIKQARQKIKQFAQEFANCQKVRWGIYLKEPPQLIGNCVLYNLKPIEKRAEIGFNLMPDFWQQGYMSEAISKILAFLWMTIPIEEIEAWTMLKNKNSQKFLEKIGFSLKSQTLQSRLSGENFEIFMIYKLSRQDWENQKNEKIER